MWVEVTALWNYGSWNTLHILTPYIQFVSSESQDFQIYRHKKCKTHTHIQCSSSKAETLHGSGRNLILLNKAIQSLTCHYFGARCIQIKMPVWICMSRDHRLEILWWSQKKMTRLRVNIGIYPSTFLIHSSHWKSYKLNGSAKATTDCLRWRLVAEHYY